jgi:hypothetical protein
MTPNNNAADEVRTFTVAALAADLGVRRTREGMSTRRRLPTVATSVVALLITGCNHPAHDCPIQGRLVAADGVMDKACSLDMYLEHRADRLTHFPVSTGHDFAVAITLPVAAPRQRWFSVVRCVGYEEAKTSTFELGAGWGSCPAVSLGTVTLTPLATAHQARVARPPNKKMQLTSRG